MSSKPKAEEVAAALIAGSDEIVSEPAPNASDKLSEEEEAMESQVDAMDVEVTEEIIATLDPWHKLELINFRQDIKARKEYAGRIFKLIRNWLAAILAILILDGFWSKRDIVLHFTAFESKWTSSVHFELADKVLIALIGGTTASVIGLFAIVANYLFPKRPEKDNKKKTKTEKADKE